MLNDIIKYAQGINVDQDVFDWINTHLKVHFDKEKLEQSEIEHVIDYFASSKRPKRISKMSYKQAKSNTDKWNKALIKKGSDIQELDSDIEIIKDFNDGFKIVKLVGKNAYKREGFLMRHCVASYYGRSVEIYSLRDKDNMPHCTMQRDQQVKGKGNGAIHPKYIKYIVAFLEEMGMTVGDSEMKNLGYVNVSKIKDKLHKKKNKFYNDVYLYQEDEFIDESGEQYSEFDLWQYKPVITKIGFEVKFNFELDSFINDAISKILTKTRKLVGVANDSYSTAVANSYNSTAVANSYYSTAVANDSNSTAVANSYYSTAVANSYNSTAVANSYYSTAVANDSNSTAVANDSYSTAVANDYYSTAVANDSNSTAVANDSYSTAVANSYNSTAVANSYYSTAVANDSNSTAVANDSNSTAVANSYYSTAVANSYNSTAVANDKNSIALCRGQKSKAKGKKGAWLVIAEYDAKNENIINIATGLIDGKKLKENVLYGVKNGKFIEVK